MATALTRQPICCRDCSAILSWFSTDKRCPECSLEYRSIRLAAILAMDANEPVDDFYQGVAFAAVKRFSYRAPSIAVTRPRGQRWCLGCERFRFAGAWSLQGVCRFCSTCCPEAQAEGAEYLRRKIADERRWRDSRNQVRFTRQEASRHRRDARPQADGRTVFYLYESRGFSSGHEAQQPLVDRLSAGQEWEPDVIFEREELAGTLSNILGNLDEQDIANLDPERLMALRQRLIAAGVTHH